MGYLTKFLLLTVLIIAVWLGYVLQGGIPSAFEGNANHLKNKIIPEVLNNVKSLKNSNKVKKTILMPISNNEFDPSEATYAWKIFTSEYGFEVKFATEDGSKGKTDMKILKKEGLNFIMNLLFTIFKSPEEVVTTYSEMENDKNFNHPLKWSDININDYDGIYIPGGHANGMRPYLNSKVLQGKVTEFWGTDKPIAAICHGVLVLARSINPKTGKSLLYNRKSTSVSNYLERLTYSLTSWQMGDYFRTFDELTEDEIVRHMTGINNPVEAAKVNKEKQLFDAGPISLDKGTFENPEAGAFVVEDGNYLSGRYPGDVCLLAHRFAQKVLKH